MTLSKYLICRVAHIFGVSRKNTRMANAASESHLLKEAEAYLGKILWNHVEHIEPLSMEYWNLRKLNKEREAVAEKLKSSESELSAAYEDRAEMLSPTNEPHRDLLDQREAIVAKQGALTKERDLIVAKARKIRKSYEGLKTKCEVLTAEGQFKDQLAAADIKLSEMKSNFAECKKQRQEISDQISECMKAADEIEGKIKHQRQERTQMASTVFQYIGDANQTIATLRAELGILDTQMRLLYCEIGRYLSRENPGPAVLKAIHSQHRFVEVIHALRKSLLYNQKLAELT